MSCFNGSGYFPFKASTIAAFSLFLRASVLMPGSYLYVIHLGKQMLHFSIRGILRAFHKGARFYVFVVHQCGRASPEIFFPTGIDACPAAANLLWHIFYTFSKLKATMDCIHFDFDGGYGDVLRYWCYPMPFAASFGHPRFQSMYRAPFWLDSPAYVWC